MVIEKMNRKIPIIFMLMILFLSTLSGFMGFASGTLGSQEDYVEDFEDDVVGTQAHDDYFSEEWFYTSQNTTNAYVDDEVHYQTGTKSYYVLENNHVLFTMNVSDIYNISFYTRRMYADTGSWIHFEFNNATNHTIIEIRHKNDGTGKMYCEYKEWDDAWNRIGNDLDEDQPSYWAYFNFEILDIDSVKYKWGSDTEYGTPNHIGDTVDEEMEIRYVYWYLDNVLSTRRLYLDNFTITTGYEGGTQEDATIPPCTPFSTIGNIGVGNIAHGIGVKYLWTVYYVETRMYVHRLDLEVLEDYINKITITDIEAKLGTYTLGNPNSIVEISQGHYRISWTGLNSYINNTMCPIMFKFKKNFGTGQYPQYAIIYFADYDLNQDGYRKCIMCDGSYDSFWNNFKYNVDKQPSVPMATTRLNYLNEILTYLLSYTYVINNFEPVIRLCADRLTTGELKYHFENDIWCYPRTFENNSFTKIGYTVNLSQMGESNKVINIQEPDGNIKTIKSISTQSGGVTYTAHQLGLHYVNLSLGNVNVSSTNFTTEGNLDDWLETDPNPSFPNQDFDIIYNYSKSEFGVIRIFDSDNNLKQTFIANPSTSYGKETTSLDEGKYYIKLQEIVEIAGKNDYVTLFTLPHAVQGDVVPYIEVEQDVTTVDYGFRVYGEHNHVGHNIVVRVGDSEEIDVSDKTSFNFMHDIAKSGYYRVSLILKKPDHTEVELDWDYVTVKSSLFEGIEKTGVENILDLIPVFYKLLAGIIITLAITLSPFTLLIKASKYLGKPINIDIPPITYPLLFVGGTVLCTILGLYGMEILFLFLAGAFISIIFLYVSGMKSGNNGDE